MSSSNSNESSLFKLVARAWLPLDPIVVVIWLAIPCCVYIGRQIILIGVRDYFDGLSTWTQYLVGLHALGIVSILSVVTLLGAATIHRDKTRRVFMNIALFAGALVIIVYVVYCVPLAMTTIHRLG